MVSVPNVAHFDLGLRLLCGRWLPTETGMLDSTHLRFFTQETLERMFERCGWRVVARDDFELIRTDQYDEDLNDFLPLEMVGALRTVATSLNPDAAVQQFVWALKPFPVAKPPESFLQAVAREDGDDVPLPSGAELDIRRYLTSIGLLASEQNRRVTRAAPPAAPPQVVRPAEPDSPPPDYLPFWKRWALDIVYHSPKSSAAFQRLYRRLR